MKPLISYLMCVHNDLRFLDRAIHSLYEQEMTDWELIIMDNSDQEFSSESWKALSTYEREDNRIHILQSNPGVGWAKGASICLENAKGLYTSFLASDDAIIPNSLLDLSRIMIDHSPDVIFVGHNEIYVESKEKEERGRLIPPLRHFNNSNRSDALFFILNNVYYNAFFHYMKIDFLRKEGIDFFDPYYSDCAGMTQCISKASTIIVYNQMIYSLSVNTSQTKGWGIWDFYKIAICNQWQSVKDIFLREKFKNEIIISYVAERIIRNYIGHYSSMCKGRCHDKYMNLIIPSASEIIHQIEESITNMEIQEMLALTDALSFNMIKEQWQDIESLIKKDPCLKNGTNSITPLIRYLAEFRHHDDNRNICLLIDWLKAKENTYLFGINEFADLCERCDPTILKSLESEIRQIVNKYNTMSERLKQSIIYER